jgi:Ni/Co efflux regulator RcnB
MLPDATDSAAAAVSGILDPMYLYQKEKEREKKQRERETERETHTQRERERDKKKTLSRLSSLDHYQPCTLDLAGSVHTQIRSHCKHSTAGKRRCAGVARHAIA